MPVEAMASGPVAGLIAKPLSDNNLAISIFGNGITSRNEIKKMAKLFRNGS